MPPIGGIRPAGSLSELGRRIVSAIVMVLVVLAATWIGGWPFALIWMAAGIVIALEAPDMARGQPRSVLLGVLALGRVLLGVSTVLGRPVLAFAASAVSLIALAAIGRSLRDRLWGIAGWLYA